MTWGNDFISSLDSISKTSVYALRFIPGGINSLLMNGSTISSLGGSKIFLSDAHVTIDSTQITPQRWSVNFGGFTIEVVGDLRPMEQSPYKKGAIAELWIKRTGTNLERIAIGQLRSVSINRGISRLVFGDLISAMASRFVSEKNKVVYYNTAGKKANSTASFDFAVDPWLYVDNVDLFSKESTAGSQGMLTVNKSGVIGYYTWDVKNYTSAPAGRLRITDTDPWPDTANITTLGSGAQVKHLILMRDRPDHIFAKTIMSTGNFSGGFDVYPEDMGSGMEFSDSLIDSNDMDLWNASYQPSSGSYQLQIALDKQVESGIRYLLNQFLNCGMWPVFRQNALSWRVCQNPNTAHSNTIISRILDRDIIQINSHSIYSDSQSNTFFETAILTLDTSKNDLTKYVYNNVLSSLPVESRIERDNRMIYSFNTGDVQSMANADLDRLQSWDFYTYEEIILTVLEKFAVLVAGDIVEITSRYIYGLSEAEGKTYQGRRAMVLGNRWQPNDSRCIIRLGIIPN
tara:strand:+ start:243 stop:1787 length:1545 start_codon:yes stop_codon:yes gene_type:complete